MVIYMKIIVKAKPGSKKILVEKMSQPTLGLPNMVTELDIYKVWVKEPPVDGKANDAISRALAEYFDIGVSRVILVSGQSSKTKIFKIDL